MPCSVVTGIPARANALCVEGGPPEVLRAHGISLHKSQTQPPPLENSEGERKKEKRIPRRDKTLPLPLQKQSSVLPSSRITPY